LGGVAIGHDFTSLGPDSCPGSFPSRLRRKSRSWQRFPPRSLRAERCQARTMEQRDGRKFRRGRAAAPAGFGHGWRLPMSDRPSALSRRRSALRLGPPNGRRGLGEEGTRKSTSSPRHIRTRSRRGSWVSTRSTRSAASFRPMICRPNPLRHRGSARSSEDRGA